MENNVKQDLEDLLLDMVERVVTLPESVRLTSVETQNMIGFELRVDPTDFGKVLGQQGKTIESIRHLLMCAARMRNVRVNLDLVDPDPSRRRLQRP